MEISTLITDEDYEANGEFAQYYHSALCTLPTVETASVMEYLQEERGLSTDTIGHFNLGLVPTWDEEDKVPAGHNHLRGMISIPYMNERGVTAIRFRAMPGSDGPKYLDLPGAGTWLYNVTAISHGGSTITICEGEVDTMTAHQMGLHAVGLSGVQKWKTHHRHLLEGFSHIRVLCDNDDSGVGMELGETIKKAMPNTFVELLPAPDGHDVNSAYLEGGAENLLEYWGISPDFNTYEGDE